jgi:hypothetical protein
MMKQDRIQVNGVWYVRETAALAPIELDPTEFEGIVVEDDKFCFEATRIRRDSGGFYDDIDMKFIDKRVKPFKEEHWDSNAWMKGILNNNPDSHKELPDIGSEGIRFLQAFLQLLIDKGWL